MQKIIAELIQSALKTLSIEVSGISIEHPADLHHGDYSTNIALVAAKEASKKPREVAEAVVAELRKNTPVGIEKIEVAGAGFINFYLSNNFFYETVCGIDGQFGRNNTLDHKKIFFEYTQPNPFKEFHIGHLMNNMIGESVSRILEWNGGEVKRATYHGDVGMHVAKAIWGMKKLQPNSITVETLGKAYAEGNTAYEDNEAAKQEIIAINKKVYESSDKEIGMLYEKGRTASLEHFESLYKKLGSSFDFHFFESESGVLGKKIVLENIGKVFEKSDGATVFQGEKCGLHTRVFLNSEEQPTYEAKEIGLIEIKRKKYPFDVSITVTANEQKAFFEVVTAALTELYPELKGKIIHLSHGMLKLPSGKMSSRTGTVVTAESLLALTEEKVKEVIKGREFDTTQAKEVVEKVSLAAIRYSILRQAIGGDIIFDLNKSVSFEGDSGPYLQYSYARAKSILRKAHLEVLLPSSKILEGKLPKDIGLLEKLLTRFPEIVERAGREYAPHHIVTYLTELAGAFNSYYAKNKILDAGEATPYRLKLTEAFSVVMKNGLNLLGINVLEKM
ncbi:MAG TPA: arginine--tRNA ligase [Candidatus Paceibacterota bacterium]